MVDAEMTCIVYEPEMTIGIVADWAVDIGTKIPMYDSTATDSIVLFDNLDDGSRPNINFELNYAGIADNVELYRKTHWDIDEAERGDITLGAAVDENATSRAAASVTVNRGTSTDGVSSLTYTYTPSSALPLGAATPVDHWVDFQGIATDLAGNVGYTDSNSSVSAGVLNKFGASHIKIDQKLPSISTAYTGWWWDTSIDSKNKTHKHTSTKANSMVVEFDGNITDIDATDFQITFDDGTTHTPTEAVIYSALKAQVFLTLGASMPADDTPKVALVGSVSDIAGNSTSTGSLANAVDKIHPAVTATLSGGSGTGSASLESASDLTKKSITLTVTTDEELVSKPPLVTIPDVVSNPTSRQSKTQ